jgi:Zn-dependent protease with chaperone function
MTSETRSRLVRFLLLAYFPTLALFGLLTATAAGGLFYVALSQPLAGFLVVPAALLAATLVQMLWLWGRWANLPRLRDPMELRLPREMLKGLYELVHDVARRRRLAGPSEIRLAADTIAHVYEGTDGRNILVIGGTALATFSQDALAGIVAHELGHFAAGDTRLMRRGYRRTIVMALLEDVCATHRASALNPLVWLLRGYHVLFQYEWAAHSRQQEFAADRHEVAHVGKEEAAAALIHVTVTERLPWARLTSIVESCIATNEPLDRVFAEQVRRAESTSQSDWQDALRKELRRQTETFDSHPALKERLAAMGVSPKKALRLALDQSGPRARDLLDNWEAIEKELTERLLIPFREAYLAKREMAQIILGRPLDRP